MLHGFPFPIFQKQFSDGDSGTPGSSYGTTVTASSTADVYGSYSEVIADTTLTEDCYALSIFLHATGASGLTRNCLFTIGKDETGGTSYTDWIVDLIASHTGAMGNSTPGRFYYFPLYIKAGTTIAAKCRNSTASVAAKASVVAYGRPKYPANIWCGQKVKLFTFSTVTLGTTSEGAWTASATTIDDNYWWWQMGVQFSDSTQTGNNQGFDLAIGDASNKKLIYENHWLQTASTEVSAHPAMILPPPIRRATINDTLYIRGQCSGTADASCSAKAWGVL